MGKFFEISKDFKEDEVMKEVDTKNAPVLHAFGDVVPVCLNGQLAKPYSEGKEKLIPVVVSHGYSGDATVLSFLCRELASFGYMAISFDHLDGTCCYARMSNGQVVTGDYSKKILSQSMVDPMIL
jgi:uncharacterized alpha/beta hydrolase family protein